MTVLQSAVEEEKLTAERLKGRLEGLGREVDGLRDAELRTKVRS